LAVHRLPDAPVKAGSSASLCDDVLRLQLRQLAPARVVDFGAGAGKNGRIVREVLGSGSHLVAVEGFERTAAILSAQGPYDEVHHSLLQTWIERYDGHSDLAVFGDVLEHLSRNEIHRVLRTCLRKFDHVIVVVPLHDIFQDDEYGTRSRCIAPSSPAASLIAMRPKRSTSSEARSGPS
jgi:hypothetical protein